MIDTIYTHRVDACCSHLRVIRENVNDERVRNSNDQKRTRETIDKIKHSVFFTVKIKIKMKR